MRPQLYENGKKPKMDLPPVPCLVITDRTLESIDELEEEMALSKAMSKRGSSC